jgi:Cu-Zn family superoxide dismutase
MRRTGFIAALLAVAASGLWAAVAAAQTGPVAYADIKDSQGKDVGRANFRQNKEGVIIVVRVENLPPGLHAVHLHAAGKCEGPKFTSAGGHFNPGSKKHGFKSSAGYHAGDLPNMLVTKLGTGRFEAVTDEVTLGEGPNSLFGRDGGAVVLHAADDDYKTDPAGNSGDRIACGVIVKGQPPK